MTTLTQQVQQREADILASLEVQLRAMIVEMTEVMKDAERIEGRATLVTPALSKARAEVGVALTDVITARAKMGTANG